MKKIIWITIIILFIALAIYNLIKSNYKELIISLAIIIIPLIILIISLKKGGKIK